MRSAIVLSGLATGLATIRGLAEGSIPTFLVTFKDKDLAEFSRFSKVVRFKNDLTNEVNFIEELITFSTSFDEKPVIYPSSDSQALLLAKYENRLRDHLLFSSNSCKKLESIIHKDNLYLLAQNKVPLIPSINSPTLAKLEQWSNKFTGPYFLKPFYEGIAGATFLEKNIQLENQTELLDFAKEKGLSSIVIQQLLTGGDDFIFDCYGYCDRDGNIVVQATHRRIRQLSPDYGTTCFGEIPANLAHNGDQTIMKLSKTLLSGMNYHGIFAIEWLQDKKTGDFFLIDFNARSFSSISHLTDCGLNLPLLAFQELSGNDYEPLLQRSKLKHKYWMNFTRDFGSFLLKNKAGKLGLLTWFCSILKCRCFAIWKLSDPLPALYQFTLLAKLIWKRIWS